MVVIGKLVHGNLQRRRGKVCQIITHGSHKTAHVTIQIFSVIVAVLLHSRKEPGDRLHKRVIIHYRIPFPAIQPASWASVMFRYDYGVGICFPYRSAEFPPELMVPLRAVSHIRRHIQPPAVGIIGRRHPLRGNSHNIIRQLSGIFIV